MSDKLEIIPYPLSAGDERGWVIRPIYNIRNDFKVRDDDEGLGDVRNLHIVLIRPGSVRGNHYHKYQLEYLLIMGGKVEIVWQNQGEQKKHRKKLATNEPVILRVPENVIHSIENISEESVYVVCYSKTQGPFPGEDVHKVKDFFCT